MEVVANKLVSETPVLERAALEELKALLDLQMKMFIEGLDELFAARDAKLDALFARSGASTSGGSGVLDATEAQEVTLDLNLAAGATSAINAEPSNIDVGAPSSCSTKCPNRVIDVFMPVPACTIAEEIVTDTGLTAAASLATTAEPRDTNIGTLSSCSTEFPNLVSDAAPLVPVTAEVIPDPEHAHHAATSVVCIEPSAVSDELDATTAIFGHNDMASRHQASATLATTDKELFPDPIFAADACSAMGIELSTIHICVLVACSTKCPIVFIDITAPAAVYATAEVTLDLFHAPPSGVLTIACIGIILSDMPDIIMDVGLPAYWTDVPLMLEPSSEVSALISWFPLDWVEQQPWPPPTSLKFITHDPVLRPLPWPSFASGFPSIQLRYFCLARAQSNVMICYQYSCLSWMGILCFLKIEPEQQHNVGSEFLRAILTAEFFEVIFGHHIVDHCAAIYVLVADTCTGALITVHELLAWLGCEIVEEPVQRKCGGNCRPFLIEVCQLGIISEDPDHRVLASAQLQCSVNYWWGRTASVSCSGRQQYGHLSCLVEYLHNTSKSVVHDKRQPVLYVPKLLGTWDPGDIMHHSSRVLILRKLVVLNLSTRTTEFRPRPPPDCQLGVLITSDSSRSKLISMPATNGKIIQKRKANLIRVGLQVTTSPSRSCDICTAISLLEFNTSLGCNYINVILPSEIGELHLDSKKKESESLPSVGLLDMEQKQLVKICCRCIQKKLLQIPARSMGFGDIVVIFLMPELAIDSELKELWVLGGATQLEQSVREHEQVTLALLFCPGLILSGTIASEF